MSVSAAMYCSGVAVVVACILIVDMVTPCDGAAAPLSVPGEAADRARVHHGSVRRGGRPVVSTGATNFSRCESALSNLADDMTMEGSVMNGIAHGPEAVRTIIGFARTLYEYQEFNYVRPYGDHDFVEDYTSVVRGEPIGGVVVIRYNEAGQAARIVTNHRPLRSVLLRSK